jgi:hypothetical protein
MNTTQPSIAYSLVELYQQNSHKPNARADNCDVIQVKHNIDKTVVFFVKCYEKYSSPHGHFVSIAFEYEPKKYQKEKPLNVDVKVKCDCESFKYFSPSYMSTQLGYGLDVNENRFPNIRDPKLEYVVCKHISKVRKYLRNATFKQIMNNPHVKTVQELRPFIKSSMISDEEYNVIDEENFLPIMRSKGIII